MQAVAKKLDEQDCLASFREQFCLPEGVIYLDGNSLGPLPVAAKQRAVEVVTQQWGQDLITSWNKHAWIDLPQQCGEQIAPLIGAAPGQVICCDSISVNLFKVLSGAIRMQPGRRKVMTTSDNFPTDIYTIEGLSEQLGEDRCELVLVDEESIEAMLDESIAVLLLTQVNFRSGRLLDMKEITRTAHAKGILVVWDLAHSAGALPVHLDAHEADFAVGCTYKYLNGGPGAPAFIYVAKRHQQQFKQPVSGWMGHASPFTFGSAYAPAAGVKQNLSGTPAVIAMSVLEAALSVWKDVDILQVRQKSMAMGEFFLECLRVLELDSVLPCVSPSAAKERGSQLAFRHEHAYAICQAWIEAGVVADFRAPDRLRVGFAPLYISFQAVWEACEKLKCLIEEQRYLEARFRLQQTVT
ncbi:kynureninase [Alteromonas lipolytica]|uniref:Kynureninase n=1 Tax=Alteromonas lipolytica TaxID=1856405 RepID=A0A1E8F8M9_9ALTE|nr:kynureninase [Alteromonas lipolytica]OFI32136.1 kynureninase [Alteromonas lipolytica]GGF83600.1 kynureninase [Alteromonas lipolytica]